MIYPERMERIAVVGPKPRLKAAIDALHVLGVVHIVEHRKDQLDIGNPLPGSAQFSEQLVKVRSVMHTLGLGERDEPASATLTGDLAVHVTEVTEQVAKNEAERKRQQERLAKLQTATTAAAVHDREATEHAIAALDATKNAIRERETEFLYAAEALLTMESRKAQTPLRFAISKNAFIVNGWIPAKESAHVRKTLEQALEGEVHVEIISAPENDKEAPIKLDNKQLISPYEALLKLYTLPKYNEIDPTTFIFLSFPFFFGFILGDVGYGLVMLITTLIVRAKYKHNKLIGAFSTIVLMSALSSIVFGFIYGEVFGAASIFGMTLPHFINREHDIMTLLMFALGVGVVHIVIALILGFIQELHHHGAWKAFCAKASWLLLLIAAGMIVAETILNVQLFHLGWALGIIAIILIIIGEGVRGAIELPGIFANIASYARLMAVGVASAGLAVVVNELAGAFFKTGNIADIIIGVTILIIGHVVNLALGLLGGFIHSLRLNYVEFFSKFYEGGGRPYNPFGGEE